MSTERSGTSHDHDRWVAVAQAAADRVRERHHRMIATHNLTSGDVQYHWSTDEATISWSRAGREFLRGRITSIGSVDAVKQTWLWSWANESVAAPALGNITDVRRYGEQHDFPLLVWPSFRSDQEPVSQATMVAVDILGAEGLWRDFAGDLEIVLAVHELQSTG
jgi:hypothetical protein